MAPDPYDSIPEETIRQRSYEIWQREHCPAGRELAHWFQAKEELRRELLSRMRPGNASRREDGPYFWDHCG